MRQLLAKSRDALGKVVRRGGPQSSLAYRRNRESLRTGEAIPEKYLRIVDHVPGETVLEFGAAEGVLALLLAREGHTVFALEQDQARHAEALQLQEEWARRAFNVAGCTMVQGTLDGHWDVLDKVETFLAVRSIYYLRDDILPVMARVAEHVEHIVLCGNEKRARDHRRGKSSPTLGEFNYYASLEGMRELLKELNFEVVEEVPDGDPIVVGRKK